MSTSKDWFRAIKKMFGVKTIDRSKFNLEQTQVMCNMWNSWQRGDTFYKGQEEFAIAVNNKLGISKSKTTIIKHIKKTLYEAVQ